MNFKRFGRTANLFDKANLEGGIYLASNGNKYGSIADGVRSGVKINVLPNTQYSLSLYSNMNISIRILQWSGETYITYTSKYNVSGNVSLTITTKSTTDKIAFNVEGVNGQYAENLMLNEGSTALPYQPYMDWTNTPHYIMGTDTDTITTLPAVLYPNAVTATVGLKGDMSQSGTPTPTTPMQPQECGERTGNLFDKGDNTLLYNATNLATTSKWSYGGSGIVIRIPCEADTEYTLSCNIDTSVWRIATCSLDDIPTSALSDVDTVDIQRSKPSSGAKTFTTNSVAKYILFQVSSDATEQAQAILMLNLGSTPLPYEPYGQYKIPILPNSTTTPVYLGEVQTTRNIKKFVLTGEEGWQRASNGAYYLPNSVCPNDYLRTWNANICLCSHYPSQANVTGTSTVNDGNIAFYGNINPITYEMYIAARDITTTDNFKAYLQQQYANGTPVTVWYILATPTTGILNEPIRKIGNYADEVSGITIPTIAGANTLSIGTTLQPSEVTVNYKGWHPVADVHEYDYLLASNPLCGISTYKDELNLATGACTRRIRKLVLTGTETIDTLTVTDQLLFRFNTYYTNDKLIGNAVDTLLCNVYKIVNGRATAALAENNYSMTTYNSNTDNRLIVHDDRFTTIEDFKAYLATQYANGTPVTVWYVLETPTTETITVPSGLSGTEEGYLNQSGTPTPSNPIYPTANEVKVWT